MAWKRGCIDLFTGWQFKIRIGIFQRVYLLCQKLFIVIPDYRSTTTKTTLTIIFVNAIFGEGLVKTYVPLLSEHHKWPYFYQARARSAQAQRACALRALGLLLADGTPTVGGGKTF